MSSRSGEAGWLQYFANCYTPFTFLFFWFFLELTVIGMEPLLSYKRSKSAERSAQQEEQSEQRRRRESIDPLSLLDAAERIEHTGWARSSNRHIDATVPCAQKLQTVCYSQKF